ncbi:DgyrCDS3516 [Dimorphilus gyrociliatus]|uniref:DgyrCDS3516 n=1 Tax=Dimorphilus gyrociliatus TaxID=2664684 RepID=A0A7I8VDF5_9ANNE|nr:DgyrCDS3516 [Dimorphilus gyrociliatus]
MDDIQVDLTFINLDRRKTKGEEKDSKMSCLDVSEDLKNLKERMKKRQAASNVTSNQRIISKQKASKEKEKPSSCLRSTIQINNKELALQVEDLKRLLHQRETELNNLKIENVNLLQEKQKLEIRNQNPEAMLSLIEPVCNVTSLIQELYDNVIGMQNHIHSETKTSSLWKNLIRDGRQYNHTSLENLESEELITPEPVGTKHISRPQMERSQLSPVAKSPDLSVVPEMSVNESVMHRVLPDATMYRSMYNVTTLLEEPENEEENDDNQIEENYRMDMEENVPNVIEDTQNVEEDIAIPDNNDIEEAVEIIPDSRAQSVEKEALDNIADETEKKSQETSSDSQIINSVHHDERPFVHMFIPFNDKPRKNQKRYSRQNSTQKKDKKDTEKPIENGDKLEQNDRKVENPSKEKKLNIDKSTNERSEKNQDNKLGEDLQGQNKLEVKDNEAISKKVTNIEKKQVRIASDIEKDKQKPNSKRQLQKPGTKNKDTSKVKVTKIEETKESVTKPINNIPNGATLEAAIDKNNTNLDIIDMELDSVLVSEKQLDDMKQSKRTSKLPRSKDKKVCAYISKGEISFCAEKIDKKVEKSRSRQRKTNSLLPIKPKSRCRSQSRDRVQRRKIRRLSEPDLNKTKDVYDMSVTKSFLEDDVIDDIGKRIRIAEDEKKKKREMGPPSILNHKYNVKNKVKSTVSYSDNVELHEISNNEELDSSQPNDKEIERKARRKSFIVQEKINNSIDNENDNSIADIIIPNSPPMGMIFIYFVPKG